MDLSICIVNWNGSNVLQKCIKSIYEFRENLLIEVIVVDNDSTDDSVEMIRSEFSEIRTLKIRKIGGLLQQIIRP